MERSRKNLFEFYYLSELTVEKIKPLSRIEKLLDDKSIIWLKDKGLFTEIILRKTLLGKTVYETVFSTSSHYIGYYKNKFHNTYLSKNKINQKLEGFLFGYPSCCVNQFINKPYSKNSLTKEQQSKLFHWACNNCKITPEIIPYYSAIYKRTEDWFNHHFPIEKEKSVFNYLPKKISYAAAVLLLSAGFVNAQSDKDTTHYIPVNNDNNLNGLSYAEEVYLGAYDGGTFHSSHPYAQFYKMLVDSLPNKQSDKTYREDHMMRGVVPCPKCGMMINMGYVSIINPVRNLQMDISYLGLHFMEYGHFSFGDDTTSQRINIDTLKKILFSYDVDHMLPVTGDSDGDGLTDTDEDSLSINFTSGNPDFDGNGVPDGPQLAEELIRLFPKLKESADNIHSSIEPFSVWGVENCDICGSTHNMGYIEITNPENKKKIQIPYLALHYLANGSFSYSGTEHQNERISPVELSRVMKTHTVFTSNDTDDDGLNNSEEKYFNTDTTNIDSNNNGITDAKELALKFVDSIKALPEEPRNDGSYVEYIGMDGLHLCSVCGKTIPMGIIKIYNPLINTVLPYEISNYAFHFLENGSFEHEGLNYWEGENRIDPIKLANYLNIIITDVDEEQVDKLPLHFSLSQNYPNPFNPTTTIKFSVPNVGTRHAVSVQLKVFDMLGREVATLVNEEKAPGNYEVTFDASNSERSQGMASGVYFYRLQAGSFSETKKFVLMK